MNFDKFRVLVRVFIWVFCLSLCSATAAYALEVASPSNLFNKQDLEDAQSVQKVSGAAGGLSFVPAKTATTTIPKIKESSVSVKNVLAIPFEDLEGYDVLVLAPEVASPSSLKKGTSLKSIGSSSTIYGSLTSSTAINLFDHYCNSFLPFTNYVAWRESQYVYSIVYGDIEYAGGRFTGSGKYVRFDTSNYNDYTISTGSVSSFGLNPGSYIVYSNFEGFPNLGGGVVNEAILLFVSSAFLYFVLWGIFACVPRGFRK